MSDFAPDWMADFGVLTPSFRIPLDDPGVAPDASPTVWIPLNESWRAILAGCALQCALPASWNYADQTQLDRLMGYATTLINLIGEAVASEDGLLTITILAGDGEATANVTFAGTYTAAPRILVSCDSVELAATWSAVSTTQFTAHLAAAVPVVADTTAHISWAALT